MTKREMILVLSNAAKKIENGLDLDFDTLSDEAMNSIETGLNYVKGVLKILREEKK